jgi:hypothetical protein
LRFAGGISRSGPALGHWPPALGFRPGSYTALCDDLNRIVRHVVHIQKERPLILAAMREDHHAELDDYKALIEVGNDHRLAGPVSPAAMLKGCEGRGNLWRVQ